MTRILFAWELGANLGHLTRDLPLARACRDAGLEVIFAVPNLRAAADLLRDEEFTMVQAPLLRSPIKRVSPPVNYADMLLHEGYDDAEALTGALNGWRGLIELARPALLVYNHAPTALIAARRMDLPVLLIGTGFEIPPVQSPMPSFRPWQRIPVQVLHDAESLVLAHINRHLVHSNQGCLATLADAFASSNVRLTSFPELDPFGPRVGVDYIGPVHALPRMPKVVWQGGRPRRIFAYLRPSLLGCDNLLAALQALDAEVVCTMPGLPKAWCTRYDKVRFLSHPADLNGLLPGADLVITYGAGTIATALLAAVPVLLMPQMVEQLLAGLRLEATGAGLILREPRSPKRCAEALANVLNDPRYTLAAVAFAQMHAGFDLARANSQLWAELAQMLNPERP